jgi:hypothetical protein
MESRVQKITSDEKLLHGTLTHLRCNGTEEKADRDGNIEKQRNGYTTMWKPLCFIPLKGNGKYVCHLLQQLSTSTTRLFIWFSV